MTITVTHTRTHLTIEPANPWLVCSVCLQRVEGWHDSACDCDEPGEGRMANLPCWHRGDYADLCPTWGPVDGCTCAERGYAHPTPAEAVARQCIPDPYATPKE